MCTAIENRFQNWGSLTPAIVVVIVRLCVDVLMCCGCIAVRKRIDQALTASRKVGAEAFR